MRTLVIVNPRSGGVQNLAGLTATLRAHPSLSGAEVRISSGDGGTSALAEEGVAEGFRRIVAAGGDGTLSEVVNGVGPSSGVVVGLLALGTGNDFARGLGLPLTLEGALDALSGLRPRRVDLVRVAGSVERYCVNASAGGFGSDVDREVTPERKSSWGALAYARSALDVLPGPPAYTVRLGLDGAKGSTLPVLSVVVANGRTVAGGVPVAPRARIDDGLLDVVVVRPARLARLAALGSRMLAGSHLDDDLVEHFRVRRVSLRSDPEMRLNLDGELLAVTPLDFEVLPGALELLAPPPPRGRPTGRPET